MTKPARDIVIAGFAVAALVSALWIGLLAWHPTFKFKITVEFMVP